MRLGHDQFHKYTTAKVTFESQPGLFMMDGIPLSRSSKYPGLEEQELHANSQNDFSPLLGGYSDYYYSSTRDIGTATGSRYPDIRCTTGTQRATTTAAGTKRAKALVTNRLKIPERHLLQKLEYLQTEKQKKADQYNHIYKDNNFMQIRIKEVRDNPLLMTERLVFSSERQLRSTKHMHSCVVHTPKPPNASLGLSPLRQYGRGQDKRHHNKDKAGFLFSR